MSMVTMHVKDKLWNYEKEFPGIVKSLLDRCGKKVFKDNLPSVPWVYRYLKHWPMLSARLPEHLGAQRAHINEEQIRKWFHSL